MTQVLTQDWNLANQIADHILIGKAFAFVGKEVFNQAGLTWVKRFFGQSAMRSQVFSLLGPEAVNLPAVSLSPIKLPKLRLASITSDKALYREKRDDIYLLALDPLSPDTDTVLEVKANGTDFSKHNVHFNQAGVATLLLRDLPSGSYEVRFRNAPEDEPACTFTVAEYRLAPLVASLVERRLQADKLTVKIRLEAFGTLLNGPVQLELTDRGHRLAVNRADAVEGLVETSFNLTGEGPHAINIQLVNDPGRTATVPIVGSRAAERKQTTFSQLGTTVQGSLLPSENTRAVKGIFLEEGAQTNSPFRLEKVDSNIARLRTSTSVESASIVIIDHTFPVARTGAVDPNTAPHPASDDEIYRFGEKLFQDRKFSQARVMFEEKRATLSSPHPNYAYYIACCYAREGERKRAVTALRMAIEDGWNDFAHMINDDDLASLHNYPPYEMLKTGGRKTLNFETLAAGETVEIEVPAPAAILAIGAYVDGKAWEGWAAMVAPGDLAPKIKLPETCRPSSDIKIEVNLGKNRDASVYLIVKDARLLSADTPTSRLAGQIKDLVEKSSKDLMFGTPQTKLHQFLTPPPEPVYYKSIPMPTMARSPMVTGALAPPAPMMQSMPMPVSAASPSAGSAIFGAIQNAFDSFDSLSLSESEFEMEMEVTRSAPGGGRNKKAIKEEGGSDKETTSKPITVEDPEVLFAGLIPVNEGVGSINLRLGEAFADYVVEAFVISGLDWASAETRFRAEKEIFAVLDVPLFVHPNDTALGRVHLGSSSGQISVQVNCDGKPIPLIYEGRALEQKELISASRAEVSFLAVAGDYEVMAEDPSTNRVDYANKRVNIPGKFKYLAKTLCFLREGEKVSLDSDSNIFSLRVMPSLEKPFKALVYATSDYGHACCEQTAAIMLSACAMYTFAGDDIKSRNHAEGIIIAGVRREQSMWLKGRGFKMYPDYGNEPHSYYGPKAARYLWNLALLRDSSGKISSALAQAIEDGLTMAKDTSAAYKIDWPPKNPTNSEEAYGAVRFGNIAREEALKIARKYADTVKTQAVAPSNPYLGGAVYIRTETAYAAATLLRAGSQADFITALSLANKVVKDLGENGRLYSTVDSVAAIALMSELQAAKIVSGAGKVEVNDQKYPIQEAINITEKIRSINCIEGVIPVEITRTMEEDWEKFSAGLPVRISLEKDNRAFRQFNVGDAINLKVKIESGYKVGDLLWVCLPEALSRVIGGGQVKKFSMDFEGKDEISVPLAATSITVNRDGGVSPQHFAICVRNMFEEERVGSPGLLDVNIVLPNGNTNNSILGRAMGVFRNIFK